MNKQQLKEVGTVTYEKVFIIISVAHYCCHSRLGDENDEMTKMDRSDKSNKNENLRFSCNKNFY